jgi:hypothetical protein
VQTLIDVSMVPESVADTPYCPESDVVLWNRARDSDVVAEVFIRPEGTYGFRYSVWVAWRDAGQTVRSHSWWRVSPSENLFTDSFSDAQSRALSFLVSRNILPGELWHTA